MEQQEMPDALPESCQNSTLQNYLLQLEGKFRTAAELLRNLDVVSGDVDENGKDGNSTARTVTNSIQDLQKEVDACDELINERLRSIRSQAEAFTQIHKAYQKMFPEHFLRLSATVTSNGTAEKPMSVTGGVCHSDVRHYLSRLVRWDPLELRSISRAEVEPFGGMRAVLTHPASAPVHPADGLREYNTQVPWTQDVFSRSSHTQLAGSQRGTHGSAQHGCRPGLKPVVDDLVLHQLRYDGIPLTAGMEMALGCYERMAVPCVDGASGDNIPTCVAIPQEIRRGLQQPPPLQEGDGDLLEMVVDAYPHTIKWIVEIVGLCTLSTRGLRRPLTVAEGLAELIRTENEGAPPYAKAGVARSGSLSCDVYERGAEEAATHNTVPHQEAHDSSDTVPFNRSTASQFSSQVNEEDDESGIGGSVPTFSRYVATEMMQDEEQEYADEASYFVAVRELIHRTVEERGDEDQEQESGLVSGGGFSETEDENEELTQDEDHEEEEYSELVEPPLDSEHESGREHAPCSRGKVESDKTTLMHNRGEARLTAFVMQRLRVLLSDLMVVTALQRLALIISNGRKEISKSAALHCDNSDVSSTSLQRAAAFVLAMCRHPLVVWRLAAEREFLWFHAENANKRQSKSKEDPAPSLLLSFRHIIVALGYMPLFMGSEEKQLNEEVEMKGDSAKERQAQDRLLWCVAPFLHLWGGVKDVGCDVGVVTGVVCDPYEEDGVSPVVPITSAPLVWRESVLMNLLDQVGKLNQLEALFVREDNQAIQVESNLPTPAFPEGLLYRFMYPLSKSMLHNLDDHFEMGLIKRVEGSPSSRYASRGESLQGTQFRLPPSRQQQVASPQLTNNGSDGPRRSVLNGFISMVRGMAGGRNTGRSVTETDTVTLSGSGNGSQTQEANAAPKPPGGQSAIIIELPYADTILLQQDRLQCGATPTLLTCMEGACFFSANPVRLMNSCLEWQPVFQKTMCYCPVVRRRCIDVCVHGLSAEKCKMLSTPLTISAEAGFNPAQLLNCGHVISYRAMKALAKRPEPSVRGGGGGEVVMCPYCRTNTPVDKSTMLSCIY
uniref:Uncharacterized protein n=1 Tax=Trypanosoma congolense (strain IL3000) TaxID=1068625 RepID=G0UPH6_TRYCI|nr:conserved hypothetical protein [Trypanosoma congolense IL3000]